LRHSDILHVVKYRAPMSAWKPSLKNYCAPICQITPHTTYHILQTT